MAPYNRLQPRGPDGRWIAHGGRSVAAAKKGIAGFTVSKSSNKIERRTSSPSGVAGLKPNFVPYARVNKRSITAGYNVGTRIPGRKKRIVHGSYMRFETTKKHTAIDRFAAKGVAKVFPKGTRRGAVAGWTKANVSLVPKANRLTIARANLGGKAEVRIGTSRHAGPTLIIRRGKHRVPQAKSQKGINRYNRRMNTIKNQKARIGGTKRHRPQRRKAARRKKK